MSALLDPTLIYTIFTIGLWLAVTAILVPGTGLIEIGAGAILITTFVAMGNLATNWLSVALIIVGVSSILLLPLIGERFGRFAELGLILQGIGAAFLFRDTMPNWIVITLTLAAGLLYNRLLLVPMGNRMRQPASVGNEVDDLIGSVGRIVAAVNPPATGTAQINGELWTVSSYTSLRSGDLVRVIETKGLQAVVERAKEKHPPTDEQTDASDLDSHLHSNGAKPEARIQ